MSALRLSSAHPHRLALAAALLALLLHSLLPLLHHTAMRIAAAQASLESIVICSANGFRVVKLDSAGQPVSGDEAPAPDKTLRYCPICTAAAPGPDLLAPILPLLPLPALLAAASFFPLALPDVSRPALFAGQPRAPPLFR